MAALGIVGTIVIGTIVFALLAARRSAGSRAAGNSAQEYIIGGRSFGPLLLWILMGGEIYTTFTFLGAAGWVYGRGAPAYYILAYGPVAYIIGYFFMPALWEFARVRGLLTAADFFVARYGSKRLGTLIALLQFCAVLPWYTLQLTGLQILLTIAGYGRIVPTAAVAIGFGLTALFVFTAGLRGTAWASVVKDALILISVLFVGIALPGHFFGSPARMLTTLEALRPHWFTLASPTAPQGTIWYVTTVALTGIGFFMSSQSMSAIYAGKSARAVRRNAIFLPLYQLMLVPVFFAGYTALLVIPGLLGTAADRSYRWWSSDIFLPGFSALWPRRDASRRCSPLRPSYCRRRVCYRRMCCTTCSELRAAIARERGRRGRLCSSSRRQRLRCGCSCTFRSSSICF